MCRGSRARGDELVIRLRTPAPEFPLLAALSCAVPVATPVVPFGLETPVPSAGPYYLAAYSGSVAVLKPNPNYGGSRPQQLDAIAYRMGVSPNDAAAQIQAGTLDYYLESQRPTLTPEAPAARAAGKRYRMTPDGGAATQYLALNWRRPLFADIRMRRAVQYALDRTQVPLPATRIGSPRSPGYDDSALYPLAGDVAAARELTRGRKTRAVLLTFVGDPYSDAFTEVLRIALARIRMSVTLLPLTNDDFSNGGRGYRAKAARSDLSWGGANAQTADPVDYLRRLVLPRREWDELSRIGTLASPERERRAAALARRIDQQSLFAVYGHSAVPELVSKAARLHRPPAGVRRRRPGRALFARRERLTRPDDPLRRRGTS